MAEPSASVAERGGVGPLQWRGGLAFTALATLALVAWLLVRPADQAIVVAVDNIAQFLGLLLLVVPACLSLPRRGQSHRRAAPRAGPGQPWTSPLLACGIASYVVGQIIVT